MIRFKDILSELVTTPALGTGPATDTTEFAKIVSDRVRGVMKSNMVYFNICTGFVVALFIAAMVMVTTNLNSSKLVMGVLGGFGAGAIGLVSLMLQRWREKVAAEVLLELAVWFQGDQLKMIVNVLHRWLNGPASTPHAATHTAV